MNGKYEGWTNYETWAVKLWIDNDEDTQGYWQAQTRIRYAEAPVGDVNITQKDYAQMALACQLRSEHHENAPEMAADIYSDLLNAGLDGVNWDEIADEMLNSYLTEEKVKA